MTQQQMVVHIPDPVINGTGEVRNPPLTPETVRQIQQHLDTLPPDSPDRSGFEKILQGR